MFSDHVSGEIAISDVVWIDVWAGLSVLAEVLKNTCVLSAGLSARGPVVL